MTLSAKITPLDGRRDRRVKQVAIEEADPRSRWPLRSPGEKRNGRPTIGPPVIGAGMDARS
jgi:hypothetical protein